MNRTILFCIFAEKIANMRRLLYLIMFCLCVNYTLDAQSNNKIDSKGRRQGEWSDVYTNGNVRYRGMFKNDKPVGEFKYYDEEGVLKATNVYDKSGVNTTYTAFAPNGKVIAKGFYKDKKKDGEWRYFSPDNAKLILVESYSDGILEGQSKVYDNKTGRVAEDIVYKKGEREGLCTKYYADGKTMAEITYSNGLKQGHAKLYYPNGVLQEEGEFCSDNKCGEWKIYSDEGDLLDTESYDEQEVVGRTKE